MNEEETAIKTDLKEIKRDGVHVMTRTRGSSCEHVNETPGSTKQLRFLGQVSKY
jgi:hypothetical protein